MKEKIKYGISFFTINLIYCIYSYLMNYYDLKSKYSYELHLDYLFLLRLICFGGIGAILYITSLFKNEMFFKFKFSALTIFSVLIFTLLIVIQMRVFSGIFSVFNMETYIVVLNIFWGYIFAANFISRK